MNRSTLAALLLAAAAPAASAQLQELSFTTLGNESTLSGSSGTVLATVTPEDVAVVIPQAGASAELFVNHLNLNTLTGDGDGDAFYHEPIHAGAIDALQICAPTPFPHTPRDLFFSTKIGLPFAGGGGIQPSMVGTPAIGATPNIMITESQIRTALGITPNVLFIDVDAIAVDDLGTIFLSFEEDMPIFLGTQMLFDGGVAAIPASTVTWSGCNVTAVTPNSGVIAFNENFANFMTVNANIADNAGNFIQVIFDLDGLEIDPNGGTFTTGGGTFPNLIFSGEYYTGGGILSTAGFGSVATINGVPMASNFPGITDGTQVGLDPTGVGSLDGLALRRPTCRFIMDSDTPEMLTAGPLNLCAGGADPGQLVYFYATIYGASGPGNFQPSILAANPCFPEWFLWNTYLFAIPADGLGIADVTLPYGGGVPAGNTVVFQSLTNKTIGWSLSAPITLQF